MHELTEGKRSERHEPTEGKRSERLLFLLLGGLVFPLLVGLFLMSCEGKRSGEPPEQQARNPKGEPGERKEPKPGGRVIAAEDAKRFVGEYCTVEMVVRGARRSKKGTVWFLNSESNYRNPNNLTVMIGEAAVKDLAARTKLDGAASFVGKWIRVAGTIRVYQDRPEMVVDEAAQLTVLPR
jgi:hypothetical protein